MIQANELRIGNYVSMFGEQILIVDISLLMGIENGVEFIPIPLTPEILEKCGFEWSDTKTHSDDRPPVKGLYKEFLLMLNNGSNKNIWYAAPFGYPLMPQRTYYLHQLQNLYFALTGEELTFNQ